MSMQQCLYPLFAYFLGSIPFGLIFSELFGSGGLREKGSKNIGSTNVLRTQGKLLGALTLICDFSKAFIPCYFFDSGDLICNLLILVAPTIGHMFPIWLKFKGGKGVATFLGTIGAISWAVLLGAGLIWMAVFAVCRISSVSCLIAVSCSLLLYRYVQNDIFVMSALIFLVILIFIKHKDNLIRLHNNQEKRL